MGDMLFLCVEVLKFRVFLKNPDKYLDGNRMHHIFVIVSNKQYFLTLNFRTMTFTNQQQLIINDLTTNGESTAQQVADRLKLEKDAVAKELGELHKGNAVIRELRTGDDKRKHLIYSIAVVAEETNTDKKANAKKATSKKSTAKKATAKKATAKKTPKKAAAKKAPQKQFVDKAGVILYDKMTKVRRGMEVTMKAWGKLSKDAPDMVTGVALFADWDYWQGKLYIRVMIADGTDCWKILEKITKIGTKKAGTEFIKASKIAEQFDKRTAPKFSDKKKTETLALIKAGAVAG